MYFTIFAIITIKSNFTYFAKETAGEQNIFFSDSLWAENYTMILMISENNKTILITEFSIYTITLILDNLQNRLETFFSSFKVISYLLKCVVNIKYI